VKRTINHYNEDGIERGERLYLWRKMENSLRKELKLILHKTIIV